MLSCADSDRDNASEDANTLMKHYAPEVIPLASRPLLSVQRSFGA